MLYTNYKNIKKLGLLIICFEGSEHLYNIISELRESVDYVSIGLLRLSYHGDKISQIDLQEMFRLKDEDHLVDNIVEIELDTTKPAREQETDKRNILIQDAEDHGCSHAIVIDSDEYYTKKSFENACKQIDDNNYEITYCQYVNYYHDYTHFLVYPFKDGMYVPFVTRVKYRHSFECTDFTYPSDPTRRFVRPYSGVQKITGKDGKVHNIKLYTVDYHIFQWNEVKMHHLSWLRADIRKKLNMWSSKKCFDNYNDLIDRAVDSFENFDPNSTLARALMLFNTPDHSVDVKAFPKQYIHPKVDFNTRLRKVHNYKKLLVLTMNADMPIYNKLEQVASETWRKIDTEKYPNIDVDFWTYTDAKEGEETHIDKDNHIIYVKKDYTIDGLYQTFSKTIFAFKEIQKMNLDYDYIVRTNNSIWLNIPLLNEFLSYEDDDSKIFTGRIYGSFWSAFNIYAGGELMVFSKRNINIITSIVDDPIKSEKQIPGCDDNLLFGIWNRRLILLNLLESKYLHSFEDSQVISKEIPIDYDFAQMAIQMKTYDVSLEERMKYDIDKLYDVDKKFRETTESLDDMYDRLMNDYYDSIIHILPASKQEWNDLTEELKTKYKFQYQMAREEGLKYLRARQKECGYAIARI